MTQNKPDIDVIEDALRKGIRLTAHKQGEPLNQDVKIFMEALAALQRLRDSVPDGLSDSCEAFTIGDTEFCPEAYDKACDISLEKYSAQPHHLVKDAAQALNKFVNGGE